MSPIKTVVVAALVLTFACAFTARSAFGQERFRILHEQCMKDHPELTSDECWDQALHSKKKKQKLTKDQKAVEKID